MATKNRTQRFRRRMLAAAIHVACFTPACALAADDDQATTSSQTESQNAPPEQRKAQELGGITVTAQKVAENVQKVPISMDVLDTAKLTENNVKNLDDYSKLLPSVSIQHLYLGETQVYMRGVASGSNGNHSGPLPSVGMYLDEQPITTIQGALDMNIYDVERVESLAGPQGTLYGASSQAGTIRIITNKPDPSAFDAGYSLEGNWVDSDDTGYVAEGFVNLPVGESAAVRLVGWSVHDAGWIDNNFATRAYPLDINDPDDDFTTD
ncbi:MAG TPA: TonB-dependent receptor plug domain-containing protein, partial [Rhodanobacteraceae bacterium]|nr:TonB-dependent receptor plug domain-containing protein [Rhodanobacteraceae bacterium]